MSGFEIVTNWKAPGPVAAAFCNTPAFVAGIMGPVGSAKTTTALVRILKAAMAQRPSPIDGVRRCRALVLRDTFVTLKRTVLNTWHSWFPKTVGQWVEGPPARHTLMLVHPLDGGPVELIVDFMGIGDDSVENLLRSYEPTVFYVNEADLLSFEVLAFLVQRVGRYPSRIHGGPTYYGGWLDFNAPEQDHWLHELFVENIIPGSSGKPAKGYQFFRQPGGLEPNAENRENLPPRYYETIIENQPEWLVRRMVHNEWGYSRDGKPVYMEFSDTVHVKPGLKPIKGIPIGIGADAGGTPAATFGQWLPGDVWHVLGEVVTGPNVGVTRFGEMILEVLARDFEGWPVRDCYGWIDPSAAYGGDEEGNDPAFLDKLRRVTGIPFRPTATNNPRMRQEAVRKQLRRLVDGKPAFVLSDRCKVLRKAMNSAYRYKQLRGIGNAGRYDTKPEKNEFSHVAESAEYLLLGGGTGMAGVMGIERRGAGPAVVMADSDYSIFGD